MQIKTLDEYQQQAEKFALFKSPDYPYYGLAEETGEFMGKLAKAHRGDKEIDAAELDKALHKELGDVMWMVSSICSLRGWSLQGLCEGNIAKLTDRQKRNVIQGEGDER